MEAQTISGEERRNGCVTPNSAASTYSVGTGVIEGRMQDADRIALQTVRYVLDGSRSQCHSALALLHLQRPFRGLLRDADCLNFHFYVAHPPPIPKNFCSLHFHAIHATVWLNVE